MDLILERLDFQLQLLHPPHEVVARKRRVPSKNLNSNFPAKTDRSPCEHIADDATAVTRRAAAEDHCKLAAFSDKIIFEEKHRPGESTAFPAGVIYRETTGRQERTGATLTIEQY